MNQDNMTFDLPKNRSNVIKVIGVGGGGSNAVNYMFNQGFNGVDFVVCNTDAQALHSSPVPNKVQLGVNLTEGLGAGARPEVGGEAAEESLADLERMLLSNTKMLFLTAGMGGGTGTGAAPVIAKLASKLGILTVGIVTMPFKFEGAIRLKQAQAGMEELQKHVDSMIVINNNKLRDVYGNLGLKSGFAKADEVLATAAKGISEVITKEYGMNIDLHDVKTVLEKSGTAIMGAAIASGEDRAINAITKALDSPLLNDNSIRGAKNVLLLVVSGDTEITLDEIGEINEHIQDQAGGGANIILGAGDEEEGLGDNIKITIIATGFSKVQQDSIIDKEPEKIVHHLDSFNKTTANIEEQRVDSVVKEKEYIPENRAKKIVHLLEADDEDEYQKSVTKIEPTIEIEVEAKVEVEQKIELPTVEKDIESYFDTEDNNEIMNISDDDIIIQNIDDNQTSFEFDFEMSNDASIEEEEKVPEKKYFDLAPDPEPEIQEISNKDISEIETNFESTEEVINEIPLESKKFVDGSIKYNLGDYEDLEKKIESAKPEIVNKIEEVVVEEESEPEMQLHIVKKIEQQDVIEKSVIDRPLPVETYQDPTDIPLSKKEQMGRERRERLNRFNHKFKSRNINSSTIDDLEKEPAYRRAGIEVSLSDQSIGASRYSVSNSNDDDVVIRKNNSFLHDNVD